MYSYSRCLQQLQSTIQISSRKILDTPSDYKRAAVLVPIYLENNQWYILFTRRTEKVTHHKNEISFPGGGFDEGVDSNITETAIREIEEEIGCTNIEVIGLLDDIFTISGYIVTPVVGKITNSVDANCKYENSDEIQYIINVPLKKVANPLKFWTQEFTYSEDQLYHVPFFDYEGEIIWGATGRILLNFLRVITQLPKKCREQFIDTHIWTE